jgi:hypothetical protein
LTKLAEGGAIPREAIGEIKGLPAGLRMILTNFRILRQEKSVKKCIPPPAEGKISLS